MPLQIVALSCLCFCLTAGFASGDPVASALCRTECLGKFLKTQPKEDKLCSIQPDCFLCWEHCGLLSRSNTTRENLCDDHFCSEGCEVACQWFRSKRQLPKDRLIFPKDPTLEGSLLQWDPVPGANLYSVSIVFANRTVADIAQTVSTKLRIQENQLMKAVRIVVIAVNNSGALGIANYGLSRRLVKKNASITAAKLKEILNMTDTPTRPPPPPSVPTLWLRQGSTESLDTTIGRTNISWDCLSGGDRGGSKPNNVYLVKWWTPHLNMEGRIVVNNSNWIELTYLSKYFTFVKVIVLGTGLESQILVLRKEPDDRSEMENIFTRHWIFLLSSNFCIILTLILIKSLWSCSLLPARFTEKSQLGYDVYT